MLMLLLLLLNSKGCSNYVVISWLAWLMQFQLVNDDNVLKQSVCVF